MSKKEDKDTLFCSFCGKSQKEVKKLIAGPTVFVSDECVELCMDIIKEDSKNNKKKLKKDTPKPSEVKKFLDAHKMIFVIEQNRDGQLSKLLISETEVDRKKIKSIRLYNGIPIFPKDIVDKIQIEINAGQAA